jgi:hypothetical protein
MPVVNENWDEIKSCTWYYLVVIKTIIKLIINKTHKIEKNHSYLDVTW